MSRQAESQRGQSDVELLSSWRGGDKRAGNELLQRHFASVYRFFEINVGDEVEDLTQRTFEACIVARDRLRDDASFRAYLFGIARKQLLKYFEQRQARARSGSPAVAGLRDDRTTPSAAIARVDQQQLFLHGLERMPEEFRQVLELFYWEERKIPDIADTLGIAVGTVKSRLHRGKALLRDFIRTADASEALQRSAVEEFDRRTRELEDDAA